MGWVSCTYILHKNKINIFETFFVYLVYFGQYHKLICVEIQGQFLIDINNFLASKNELFDTKNQTDFFILGNCHIVMLSIKKWPLSNCRL